MRNLWLLDLLDGRVKEEMAFLRAAGGSIYDQATANHQNRMMQVEGDKVNVGLISLRRIQRNVDDEA